MKYVFIALAVLLVLLVIFFIVFPFARHAYIKKHFLEHYGKKIYKLALHNDFYLINRLLLKTMDGTSIDIDHLLCGNKYIYVIHDEYIDGGLYARLNDRTWIKSIKTKKEIHKEKIENLLLVNKHRIETFTQITNLSPSLIINIVVINDDCKVEAFENTSKTAYLTSLFNLKKLINSLEKDNVKNIKDSQLKHAIMDIAELNERKKDERKHS